MITIVNIQDAKRVNKPWGYELWLECSDDTPYVMKILNITAGSRLSLQAHEQKLETMLITQGTGLLTTSKEPLDTKRWPKDYSETDQFFLWGSMRDLEIGPGSHMTIEPGEIHRITATTDMVIVECSTPHLDDVIRLQDDNKRPSGRIASEHD
jgi:mannose-6-phosphate isomerase-like protein (cupin superfamily)